MQIVVTKAEDLDPRGIACRQCKKLLATYDKQADKLSPSFEELFAAGALPIPNFGWLCSQACADDCEREQGIHFQRDSSGKVAYYRPDLTLIHPWEL